MEVEFLKDSNAFAFGERIPAGTRAERLGEYRGLVRVLTTANDGRTAIILVLPQWIRDVH